DAASTTSMPSRTTPNAATTAVQPTATAERSVHGVVKRRPGGARLARRSPPGGYRAAVGCIVPGDRGTVVPLGPPSDRRARRRALRMVRAATAVLALLLAPGCRGERHDGRPTRVACLGDSNTFALPPKTGVGWCELLDAHLDGEGWKARNFSYMGGTVSGEPTAAYTTAADHIARAEAAWNPDVYVLAYGTNDLK